jgi:hypothetical protein
VASGLVDQFGRTNNGAESIRAACALVNVETGVGELDDVFVLVADGQGECLLC